MGFLSKITDRLSAGIMGGVRSVRAPSRQSAKPSAGEKSGPQNTMMAPLPFPGGLDALAYQAAGGSLLSGGGLNGMFSQAYPGMGMFGMAGTFWGWSGTGIVQPRKGSYSTYRLMSVDSTLRLVRQLISAPILASQWTVRAVEGQKPKQAWLDLITDQILPLRASILNEALHYLEMGWIPFERVYEIERGGPNEGRFYKLKKVKPLLPELTQILHYADGSFAGLTAFNAGDPLESNKAWIVTSEGQAGNMYGMSRHECSYDAWIDGQYSRLKAALLSSKMSGVQPVVKYRPGISPSPNGSINQTMADGTTIPCEHNFTIAARIVDALFGGKGVCVPTTEFTDSELAENPKLATLTSWEIDLFNAGSYSPAMDGFIREREYQDKLKVRGWCWPERAVLEATTSGSRADSQQHSDNSSLDIELIDNDIASQITKGQSSCDVPGLIDELLSLNFGEDARGTVEIAPAPLSDPKIKLYTDLVTAVFNNPDLASEFAQVPDWDDVFSHLDIATNEGAAEKLAGKIKKNANDAKNLEKQKAQKPVQIGAGSPNGQPKPGVGNGRMKV